MQLHETFKEYEESSYQKLMDIIQSQKLLPAPVFTIILAKIYKRIK